MATTLTPQQQALISQAATSKQSKTGGGMSYYDAKGGLVLSLGSNIGGQAGGELKTQSGYTASQGNPLDPTAGLSASALTKQIAGTAPTLPDLTKPTSDTSPTTQANGDKYLTQDPNQNDPQFKQGTDLTSTYGSAATQVDKVNGGTNSGASTTGGSSGGGSLMDSINQAFQDSLRAGSDAASQANQSTIANQILGNRLNTQLQDSMSTMLQNSLSAQQASANALGKTLASLNSGNSSAQTEFTAQDISSQLAAQDAARLKLLRRSGVNSDSTKQAGVLAQKALLAKPTLLS